ncbi:MAG: hypothetical protein RSE44_28105 [Pseudomonas sp.]
MIMDVLGSVLAQHQHLFTFDSPLPPEHALQLPSFTPRTPANTSAEHGEQE